MPLEDLLAKNNTLMEEHNTLLKQIIATASGKAATAAAGTKATGTKANAAGELTAEALKPIVAAWLREFKADENDPENEARTDKFEAALKKLGVEKIGEITKVEDLQRLKDWTAKQVAAGRITPVPGSAPAAEPSDDL